MFIFDKIFKSAYEAVDLGNDYLFGLNGKDVNLQLAYKYFKLSVAKGFQTAADAIDFYFTVNNGTVEFTPRFKEIYPIVRDLRHDAQQGVPQACYILGIEKIKPETDDYLFQQGLNWIKTAAKKNYPPAMLALAKLYLTGNRVSKDEQRGKQLMLESALKGHIPAIKLLYHLGEPEIAEDILKRMADADNAEAIGLLGEVEDSRKNYQEAVKLFEKAASLGHIESMFNLALYYEHGDCVEKDFLKALKWYKAAAEKGDEKSMVNLGGLLESGPEEIQNHKESFNWFLRAAEKGYNIAWNEVAHCYKYGIGVEKSGEKAYESYMKAIEIENPGQTYFNLFLLLTDGKAFPSDIDKGLPWLLKAAGLKEPVACFHLGLLYKNGIGVEQNGSEAFKLFKISAEAGYPPALYELGLIYKYVLNDASAAFDCFYKSASENVYSMYELANCFFYGKGCEKDYGNAFHCYLEAAEAGYDVAQFEVGICYRHGEGCEQNFQKAIEWYEKAIAQGNPNAMVNCGIMHDAGLGVAPDYEKALYYYNMAAQRGNCDGQYCLANIYYNGREGIPVNYAEAVKWFGEAAKAKEPDSIYHLSICYAKGLGVEKDLKRAKELLQEAADLGWGPAVNALVQNNF